MPVSTLSIRFSGICLSFSNCLYIKIIKIKNDFTTFTLPHYRKTISTHLPVKLAAITLLHVHVDKTLSFCHKHSNCIQNKQHLMMVSPYIMFIGRNRFVACIVEENNKLSKTKNLRFTVASNASWSPAE